MILNKTEKMEKNDGKWILMIIFFFQADYSRYSRIFLFYRKMISFHFPFFSLSFLHYYEFLFDILFTKLIHSAHTFLNYFELEWISLYNEQFVFKGIYIVIQNVFSFFLFLILSLFDLSSFMWISNFFFLCFCSIHFLIHSLFSFDRLYLLILLFTL